MSEKTLVERLRDHENEGVTSSDRFHLREEAATALTQAQARCAELRSALDRSRVAIDDWINTYASEMCDEKRVKEAYDRIGDAGGTLAYIADVQQMNRAALKAQG